MKRFLLGLLAFAVLTIPVSGILYGAGYCWRWANGSSMLGFWEMCAIGFMVLFFTCVGLIFLVGILNVFVFPLGDAIMKVGETIDEVVKDRIQNRQERRWLAKQQEETAKQKRGSVSIVDDKHGALSTQQRRQR